MEKALYIMVWVYEPRSLSELARLAGLGRDTVSTTCWDMEERGWMSMVRFKGGIRPVSVMPHPCQVLMAKDLEAEYALEANKGEFLANKRLDWFLRDEEYVRNARPEFLVNPQTDEALEFDRYHPGASFAVEYNGLQHYRPTRDYDEAKVRAQQARDLIKEGLCVRHGITLMVLTPEDLKAGVLESKLENLVPHLKRGFVDMDGPYIKALNRLCEKYVSKTFRLNRQ